MLDVLFASTVLKAVLDDGAPWIVALLNALGAG